jgi:prefoldin subunit 5
MLAMAEADSKVEVRDSDEVINEIERTRENLAQTIDALTERVSPGNIARRTLAKARAQASRPEVQLIGGAVALVTVTVIAIGMWRRRH